MDPVVHGKNFALNREIKRAPYPTRRYKPFCIYVNRGVFLQLLPFPNLEIVTFRSQKHCCATLAFKLNLEQITMIRRIALFVILSVFWAYSLPQAEGTGSRTNPLRSYLLIFFQILILFNSYSSRYSSGIFISTQCLGFWMDLCPR